MRLQPSPENQYMSTCRGNTKQLFHTLFQDKTPDIENPSFAARFGSFEADILHTYIFRVNNLKGGPTKNVPLTASSVRFQIRSFSAKRLKPYDFAQFLIYPASALVLSMLRTWQFSW